MRFLIAAAALLVSGPALGEFTSLDRNGDGYVSRIEARAAPEIAKRFTQFDADKDRQLSSTEYAAARADNEQRAQRDAALSARVKAALGAERAIRAGAIAVETYEGQVRLSGFVPAADMASRAGRVTAGVDGVRSVHNNLSVRLK